VFDPRQPIHHKPVPQYPDRAPRTIQADSDLIFPSAIRSNENEDPPWREHQTPECSKKFPHFRDTTLVMLMAMTIAQPCFN